MINETEEQIKIRVRDAQLRYDENVKRIEDLLKSERGYASRAPKNEPVIALCSGGMDSSIMINLLANEYDCQVYPLFVKRGARAEKLEEKAFDFFMDFYKKRFPDKLKEAKKLEFEIPPADFKAKYPNAQKIQGHPLRNSTMQNLAVMYAYSLPQEVRTIMSGSVAEDNVEPEQGILSLRAQTLSACIQLADWRWQITSPFTDVYLDKRLSKSDLITYAIKQGIPLDKTRSCFTDQEDACGVCTACKNRLNAFKYINIEDPLEYME